jgi:hypothetical protein
MVYLNIEWKLELKLFYFLNRKFGEFSDLFNRDTFFFQFDGNFLSSPCFTPAEKRISFFFKKFSYRFRGLIKP